MNTPPLLAIAAGALIDGSLKATVGLFGAALLTAGPLRWGSAAQRHAVWLVALLGAPLLVPLAALRGAEVALDAGPALAVWAIGASVGLTALLADLWALRRLTGRAAPDPDHPGLRFVEGLHGPLTWGMWRPVVLLPAGAKGWAPPALDAVLAHERAHIRRGDWLAHLTTGVVQAVFWFHPAVWWARARVAAEAEHAADDAALAAGARPSDYAALLLSLAPVSGPGLGVGGPSLGARVRAVLDRRHRSPRRAAVLALCGGLSLLTLPTLGALALWTTSTEALECQPAPPPK
jgi:beta-lactamase regulating signal transducer with metallopeptidase domain